MEAATPQPAVASGVSRGVSACVLSWERARPSHRIAPRMARASVGEMKAPPGDSSCEVTAATDVPASAAADPDVALMLRVQGGDESAFQELFRKLSPRVLQYAR